MKHERLLLFSLLLGFFAFPGLSARATTYTVKAGGGGNYTTISACAAAATAGDTCLIYAGSYSGWTQNANGVSGSPITFTANSGDTVTVTSGVTVSTRSYLVFSHLSFAVTNSICHGACAFLGNNGTNHVTVDHCTSTSKMFEGYDGTATDNVFSYNTVTYSSPTYDQGFYVFGDRNRFEYNEISGGGDDCFDLGGTNIVVRNNYCHDINGATTGQHIDFIQAQPVTPALTYSLVEHNVEQHCYNDGGNCHALILRGNNDATLITGVIYRYNYAQNLNGSGVVNGGSSSDFATHSSIYNNTLAIETSDSTGGNFVSCWGGSHGTDGVMVANNISYNTGSGGPSPFNCDTGTNGAVLLNGNLAFVTGYSGSWNAPYSTEATYAALHNQNPLFANYPTDGTLQAGSPAINAGGALTTTNGAGTNSTTLVLQNTYPFQPGWAGVNGDCIRVGASTTTCITAINYSTNTATVSPAISWSNGAPVYLYKDSSGGVVLTGTNPDIGAYPFGTQTGGNVLPPTNLQASVQ
jgi:hypothetical protein